MLLKVILEPSDEGGYSVYVPDFAWLHQRMVTRYKMRWITSARQSNSISNQSMMIGCQTRMQLCKKLWYDQDT